jgi:hypothetical protein
LTPTLGGVSLITYTAVAATEAFGFERYREALATVMARIFEQTA